MNSPGPGSAGSNLDTFPSVPGDPSHVLSSAPFISFAWGVMPPGMGNVGSGSRGQLRFRRGTTARPVPSILLAMCMEGMGRSRYRLLSTVPVPMGHCDLPLSSCALPIDLCRVRVHLRWRGFGGSTSLRDLLARWAGPVPPNAQRVSLINYRRCRGEAANSSPGAIIQLG